MNNYTKEKLMKIRNEIDSLLKEEDLKSRKAINDERDDLLVKNERRLDQLDKLIRECDDYAYLLQLSKDIMWEISDAQVKTSNGRILDNEALASHIEDALDGKEYNFHDFL